VNISVVIPVWNGRAHLETLLNSLAKQTLLAGEVIVIDNGSFDGAGELASDWGARTIRFAENRGFAFAVNRGVSESTGDLVAVLNSDVELEANWTAELQAAIVQYDAWFATGLALSARNPDLIDGAWDLVSKAGMPWRAGNGFPLGFQFENDQAIQIASFTAILLRRELWNRVGPLDERFESYLEDIDFGLRCIQAQLPGRYVASARLRHLGSAALGRWNNESVRRMSRNQMFLVYKHFGPETQWWSVFVGQILWGLVAGKHGAGFAWVQGKWEGWQRRGEISSVCSVSASVLKAHECEIFTLQREFGCNWYWRWYGKLTGAIRRIHADAGYE